MKISGKRICEEIESRKDFRDDFAGRRHWRAAIVLVLALALSSSAAMGQIGPGPFAAFPSLDATDARFLGFGCAGIATFEAPVTLTMAVPADQTSFDVSFFDGDTGGSDGAGNPHWDVGNRQLIYSLYADPLRQGSPSPAKLIGRWTGNAPNLLVDPNHPTPLWTTSAVQMPDNDWWGATITTSTEAKAPSGNYFYILEIKLDGACIAGEETEANIKIAASNPMSFLVPRFGIVASLREIFNDGPIVYPGPFPPADFDFVHAPTTYDGTFQFFFRIPGGETDLRVYDGDFDFGSTALTGVPSETALTPCDDTADPDTPADYSGFPFSTAGANPQGVNTPGSPQDDSDFDIFRRGEPGEPGRVGCVRYEVQDPAGTVYRNDNPSGSFEWEQFRIATPNAVDPSNSDYVTSTPTLPAGIWSVKLVGLDLDNLNFMYANACATRINGGTPDPACPDLSPYLLGDTVWLDRNGNGVQDSGEPGIPGVIVNLVRADSLATVTSVVTGDSSQTNWIACLQHNTGIGTQGLYCLGVNQPGDYLVQIAPQNFQPGGALFGLASTTGGESRTQTVADDNVLTYDFGYRGNASVGDRVWLDLDGDGVQGSGETGLNGVTVRLLDGSGNVLATTTTSGDGNYLFNHLTAGTYTVSVDASTLPAGLAETFDLDGTATANTAAVTLGAADHRTDADFGYRGTASIGNRIWSDLNGNGAQDSGEPGLNGVTVRLLNSGGNTVATATTSGDGNYSFNNLPAGTFTVTVDASTLPAGVAPTFDLDGIGTANTATVSLAAGANRSDVDFGYSSPASVGDRVWYDIDGDGVQDGNETGLNGVTVQLVDGGGNVIASTVTAGDGGYSFSGLVAGTYTVRVVASTLPAGPSPTFDADGTATPDSATISLTAGQNRTEVDFGYRGTAAAGDRVWYDLNGNGTQESDEVGINGVTVDLLDAGGNVLATTVTAGNGGYSFAGLFAGTYTVRVSAATLPGGAIETFDLDGTATANTAAFSLAVGQNLTTADFGYRGNGSLGDRVWLDLNNNSAQDSGEAGLNGVALELLDGNGNLLASSSTAGDGLYGFAHLLAGTYTVRVVTATLPSGLTETYDFDGTATANTASVILTAGGTRSDLDFGYRGSLLFGDRVWFDYDGNGIQDTGEPGINGVVITLKNAAGTPIATTTTSGNGNYTFTNLPAGTYSVVIVPSSLPGGAVPTYDLDGVATPNVTAVTLAAGQNRTDVDFGYRGNGSLGDRVWLDYNTNGVQDAGEVGINGVTVQLRDTANNLIATATTAGDGNYTFPNLLPGTYKVSVVTSTLMSGAIQTYDLDGTATANTASVSLSAGLSRTDADFGYRVTPPGTGTIGYWKNHAFAWPVSSITIGGVVYTRDQAITILSTPSRGDKSIDLFDQLVAAKLNLIAGNNPSCIYSIVSSADAWMASRPPGSGVSGSSSAWTTASPWHTQLDNYNNGQLCAPHRN